MRRATPELRTAAERLLSLEATTGKKAGSANLPAVVRVAERLRRALSSFLGAAGFRALLARALTLAKSGRHELSAVEVLPDGSLDLHGVVLHGGKHSFADGEIVLVAHFLGLLVTFLGEAMMLRLVSDVWPKARLDDLDFDKGTEP
jgi:hypothetical protein